MASRIKRESRTVGAMVSMYCRKHHKTKRLCPDCTGLLAYACLRLQKCQFGDGKTTCEQCPVHCYRPEMREKIRVVMRYAGPRMMFLHPVATVCHLLDRRRREPLDLMPDFSLDSPS